MLASHRELQRSHVLPVALEAERCHPLSVRKHGRDDVLAEIVVGGGIGLVLGEIAPQGLPREDVDTHGGQVALRLPGLFGKLGDHVVFIHRS